MTSDARADIFWDTIIVGQGLAGTTLAWHLTDGGQRVLILDAAEVVTSSKIAAGLMTPVTGLRLALSWRFEEMMTAARDFYRRVEARTGERLFFERDAIRLLRSDAERAQWAKRLTQPGYDDVLVEPQPNPLIDAGVADARGGGFAMRAGQLDVARYLEVSRAHLTIETGVIDWTRDVSFAAEHVTVQRWRGRRVISCEGYGASRNPYFETLKFQAAKGEILTVRFGGPMPEICLHGGIWVAPTREPQVFRVGATYDLLRLDQEPTDAGRREIDDKLRALVRVPFEVIAHHAAVRPIVHLSEAVMGLHPDEPRLGLFNGLGSKGSLHAPWYARKLADHLVHGAPLPDGSNVRVRL